MQCRSRSLDYCVHRKTGTHSFHCDRETTLKSGTDIYKFDIKSVHMEHGIKVKDTRSWFMLNEYAKDKGLLLTVITSVEKHNLIL